MKLGAINIELTEINRTDVVASDHCGPKIMVTTGSANIARHARNGHRRADIIPTTCKLSGLQAASTHSRRQRRQCDGGNRTNYRSLRNLA
jgi:hypothetical protein